MRRKHILPVLLISTLLAIPAYATDTVPTNAAAIETSANENMESSGDITEASQDDLQAETRPESTETSETTETAESISGEPAEESAGASIQTEKPTMETLQEQTEGAESSVIQETEEAESTAIQETDTETENNGGNITLIEPESALDADGKVTLTMFTAENVVLPVTVTMKGTEGSVEFTVQENGQQLKMKPDTYTLTKVIDGEGEKLDDGATLEITDEGGYVYLDFTAPEETGFQLSEFIISNLIFVPFLLLLYGGFRWFKKHYI